MNPNLCRVALRRRSVLEVFDLTVMLLRDRAGLFARLLLVVVVPPWLVLSAIGVFFDGTPWTLLAVVPLAVVMQAPFTVATGRVLFDTDVAVGPVLKQVTGQVPALLNAWGIGFVGVLGSLMLCGYGGLVIFPALLYVHETSLLERVTVERSLKRSVRLAGGHVGIAVFGALSRFLLAGWCAVVAEVTLQVVFEYVLQLPRPFGSLEAGQVTPFLLFGLLASQPLFAIYRLLLYVDVRTRVEGWDLQVSLRAAGLGR